MCNIVHTCIKKYTVAVLYSCKFCTARVFLFLADHEAIQFTNIHKIQRYLCADEAKGLLVPYVPLPVRRVPAGYKGHVFQAFVQSISRPVYRGFRSYMAYKVLHANSRLYEDLQNLAVPSLA